jgi:hypothetical protein
MSNCDWGRPCDCLDCCTIYEHIICLKCGFTNVVSIVRNVDGYYTDKHGIGYYEFSVPSEPIKDLTCFKCSYKIEKIGYYTDINTNACQTMLKKEKAIEDGRVCSVCQKIEEYDFALHSFDKVQLQSKDGKLLCQSCLADVLEKELPDPSNEREKYQFNRRKLKWELSKVKQKCVDCGKERWLNAENRWKKQCETCYRKKKTVPRDITKFRIPKF